MCIPGGGSCPPAANAANDNSAVLAAPSQEAVPNALAEPTPSSNTLGEMAAALPMQAESPFAASRGLIQEWKNIQTAIGRIRKESETLPPESRQLVDQALDAAARAAEEAWEPVAIGRHPGSDEGANRLVDQAKPPLEKARAAIGKAQEALDKAKEGAPKPPPEAAAKRSVDAEVAAGMTVAAIAAKPWLTRVLTRVLMALPNGAAVALTLMWMFDAAEPPPPRPDRSQA